jgi:signal peptidase I
MIGAIYAAVHVGGYRPFRVSSSAMAPTLESGDYFMIKTGTFDARHVGEIAVYKRDDGKDHVHRIVAVVGDRIAVLGGNPVVNGRTPAVRPLCRALAPSNGLSVQISEESFDSRRHAIQQLDEGIEIMRERKEEQLAAGQFFLMGDFRDNSADSRVHGASDEKQFVGRALYIIWSDDWSRIGRRLSANTSIASSDYCSGGQ